ncbi:ribonuclease H-like domain-containing protein [Mycena leptocephala]|nr:ribonuclease H-like domain-containing protein [Mycena leptocephala]
MNSASSPVSNISGTLKTPPRQLYITDANEADVELCKFKGPCGIDIEWKPTFLKGQPENPVALLQLANIDTILLLHLCHMRHFPKQLRTLLEDPDIVKAGVGIQGDAKKLYKDCSVNIRNCVDLSLLAKSVDNARWKGKYSEPIGLARLIAAYEDRLLAKGKVTRSNWENLLDLEQREYAHAGYTLYAKLHLMIAAMGKPPSSTCYSFHSIRGRLCESSGMSWSPFNPDYDPGPPPPPRPAPALAKETSASTSAMVVLSGSLGGSRLKRPLGSNSGSSVRPSSTLARNDQAGDDSTPTAKRKRHRARPRRKT